MLGEMIKDDAEHAEELLPPIAAPYTKTWEWRAQVVQASWRVAARLSKVSGGGFVGTA
jgi:hypothetical protein